ncbi:MAG: hemerythrin domain-containing protein [Rhodocyclaceae bacterium]|nr:hemerythrin domain-containing protein [Rhodocyclaceae bacterium]
MAEPLALWHADHVVFGRLLDLLEIQVAAFHAGERPNYELMTDIVDYLRQYGDRFHHPREEAAFCRLVERDPEMRLPVNRLLQEHRVIARAGDDVLERLGEVADDVMTERADVEAAAATYLVYYRHHLATEEGKIMPLAKELLTGDDWAAAGEAVQGAPDPLSGVDFDERYRELRKHIALHPAKPRAQ